MTNQVETTVKAPDESAIFAERVAARMPTIDPAEYDRRVSMWGKYIDLELAKDSVPNYTSIHDNHRVCSVGSRDLSYSEVHTTGPEAGRLFNIASERKFAIVIADVENMAHVWLSNLNDPAIISKEQIIEHLREWDDGWK